jgi:CRP-like cAMP-binding protein
MPEGSFVFHQGDFGDKFYLIIQGKVKILGNNKHFMKLKKELELKKHQENNPFGYPKKARYNFHEKPSENHHECTSR